MPVEFFIDEATGLWAWSVVDKDEILATADRYRPRLEAVDSCARAAEILEKWRKEIENEGES